MVLNGISQRVGGAFLGNFWTEGVRVLLSICLPLSEARYATYRGDGSLDLRGRPRARSLAPTLVL